MSFWRKAAVFVLSSALATLLFATAIDIGFLRIAGGSGQIKSILSKSGVYSSIVPGLLDQAKTISSSGGDVPLSDPIVKTAAEQSLTPQFLQTNVNLALDSVYQWLNGKTSQPNFSVNLTDVKNNFADKVAAGVKQKAASLPACAALPTSTTFDAFSATCLPRGVTPDQAAAQARGSITGGKGFLDNPTITASNLKANGSNQSVFADQLKNLPNGYQHFKKSPFILGLLSFLVAITMIFVYRPKLKGLRHAGFMLIGSGLFVILFSLGLKEAVSNKVLAKITINNSVLQDNVRSVVRDIVHNLSNTYLVIGLIYLILGALAGATVYLIDRRQPEKETKETPKEEIAPSKPTPAPPKAAKKIKIQ